jgi:hypothetical protein
VESAGPQLLGQLFAQEEGIDLNERSPRRVPHESEAKKQLGQWRLEMPAVKSAYRPSGALPAGAVMFLLLGSVVGCVAGAIAGALVAGGGLALSRGLFHLCQENKSEYPLSVVLGVALLFAVVFTFVGTFVATGGVSAWCTTRFGEVGKNRNINAAVFLSVISSGMSVFLACGCCSYLGGGLRINVVGTLIAPVAIVGLPVAMVAAGLFAAKRVRGVKFCESCQSFMTASWPKTLSLGCLRALVRAVRKGRMDVAGSLLHGPSGSDGEAQLYSCPSCSRGYLEVTAKYEAQWAGVGPFASGPPKKTDTWLAVSCELPAADAERLRQELPQPSVW